jgi:hypothetical protein
MKVLERATWILVVIVFITLYLKENNEINKIEEWITLQNNQLTELDTLIDSLQTSVHESLPKKPTSDHLFDSDIRYLVQQGLDNPVIELKKSLMEAQHLIPFEGVHGGTMRVYSSDQIILLPGFYAYANFEDGHYQGAMILQYEVKDGHIEWKIIDSRLF